MARTKAAARRGEPGKNFRAAQRKKRDEAAALMASKPVPVKSNKPKKVRKKLGPSADSEAAVGKLQNYEKNTAEQSLSTTAKKLDNQRAPDEHAQRPSKKTKTANSHGGNDPGLSSNVSCDTEIEMPHSLQPNHTTQVGPDPKDLENLTSAYNITSMSIISSTSIQQKVTKILETLNSFTFDGSARPNIVLLHANASVAQKLITVVEIATREIAKSGGKYYQYNRLDRTMIEQERRPMEKGTQFTILGRKVKQDMDVMELNDDETPEESAFETMKLPIERAIEGKPIKRARPGMTVWLSRVRIESLRKAYREQTNDHK